MMWWSDNSGWSWFWMAFTMVVFWGLVAFAVVAAIRASGPRDKNTTAGATRHSPEDVLAERFARGDIDVDEYRRRSDELTAHHRT